MISTDYQLEKGLPKSKALQLVLRETLAGELASFDYNARTGVAVARTRSFPAFDESQITESDLSREVASLADDYKIALTKIDDRKRLLDNRESVLNLRESEIADDRQIFERDRTRLDAQIVKFQKDLEDAGRAGLLVRVKSFFHRIK